MPRKVLHPTDRILDAARELVLEGGARAATMNGVVAASGAPKGSVYHRFGTLDDLLAAMWLRAVRRSQAAFVDAAGGPDATSAAVAAGLSVFDFARAEPGDARLLASLRLEDVVAGVADERLRRELDRVNGPMQDAVVALSTRLHGSAGRTAVESLLLAVVDLPIGAVRRHLIAGARPPAMLRPRLEAAIRAALDAGGADGP